jgi:hypothetical protein
MPITSPHIIRQQYLDVEVNGTESDGLALQHSLPGLCQHWLMPATERVLEHWAPPDGHLYIERLEIDAGALTLERLEHDIAESVAQKLERSLREQIPRGQPLPPILSRNIEHKTAHHSVNEAFVYFLKTGSLPWSFRLSEGRKLEQVILDSWAEAAKSGVNAHVLTEPVLSVLALAPVRQRLIRQFSVVFLETLIFVLSPEGKKVMDEVLQLLRTSHEPSIDTKHFERLLWETVFATVATGKVVTSMYLVSEACRALPTTFVLQPALASVMERYWPDAIKTSALAKRIKYVERMPDDTASILTNNAESVSPNKPGSIPAKLPGLEKTPIDISEHPEAREGIYVENAGLVLLHPFLPQFFTALGVAGEKKLFQPERALCLLHFLATEQPLAPEYELMLPKILCNVPLETAVESDVGLTDVEKEEATALLEAVVRHWEVLRNTTPDGLRGSFLLRPGKVSLRDDGDWLLQVESRAYDILLDQLPWGISMIKLPWMEKTLWVEWR